MPNSGAETHLMPSAQIHVESGNRRSRGIKDRWIGTLRKSGVFGRSFGVTRRNVVGNSMQSASDPVLTFAPAFGQVVDNYQTQSTPPSLLRGGGGARRVESGDLSEGPPRCLIDGLSCRSAAGILALTAIRRAIRWFSPARKR